ncbi:MAG: hypothetical protein KME31_16170 [Tolypothrix carrinoi HA7290-LM1]|jgi:superfamily II DNA or RNA helicase|nr:hypothetical protein [Tolypothrix carrinoi HA7290-LM1]
MLDIFTTLFDYALIIFEECHHLPTDFSRMIAEYAIALPYTNSSEVAFDCPQAGSLGLHKQSPPSWAN